MAATISLARNPPLGQLSADSAESETANVPPPLLPGVSSRQDGGAIGSAARAVAAPQDAAAGTSAAAQRGGAPPPSGAWDTPSAARTQERVNALPPLQERPLRRIMAGRVAYWRLRLMNDLFAQPSTPAPMALLDDGTEVVIGIPIDDNELKRGIRRVMILSAVAATFYICHFIANLLRGVYNSSGNRADPASLWTATSSLLLELSIPACGYCGARYANRQLTCCFCSCNFFTVVTTVISFIRLNLRIEEIDQQCHREVSETVRRTCSIMVSEGVDKVLFIFSTVVVIIIGCFAFWWGNKLYSRLTMDFSAQPHPQMFMPLVGEVVSLNGLLPPAVLALVQEGAQGTPAAQTPAATTASDRAGDSPATVTPSAPSPTAAVTVTVVADDEGGGSASAAGTTPQATQDSTSTPQARSRPTSPARAGAT
eukprot:TRINITY_DN22389_c0_g3_i2.p1 TRINITY_DN22389_c0_g3~~TRINITY_DN22389_c0_g3_i2.p1  ORF type:complete len:426 (-),score=83.56 TRINITY_DN22389_c0_g3_i2:128-1405(-)